MLLNMFYISNKDEYFPYFYLVKSECYQIFRGILESKGQTGTYLPDSDSRGSSVNVSALKSKGSASQVLFDPFSPVISPGILRCRCKRRKIFALSIVFMGHSLRTHRKSRL